MENDTITQNETDFALRLLATLPHSGSVVLSPLSISLALALVHAGTRGTTRKELERVLVGSDELEESKIQEHFGSVMDTVTKAENGVETNIVNRVFVNQDSKIKQEYLDSVQKFYQAGAQNLDFFQSEQAAEIMNKFVEDNTAGKIKDLIPADSVKDAFAFLVNAVYFKADWQGQFEKDLTADRDFHVHEGESRHIPFLNEFDEHRDYTEDSLFQVLSLKYTDTRFSFAIFLPKKRFGLIDALEKTNGDYLQNLLKDLKNSYVSVHIPKFKIEKELDLKETLEAIGIKQIFDESADLSGIADRTRISSGIHKAIIEVDEDGTTAAAASAFKVKLEMMIMAKPTTFLADHPFLFMVLFENHPLFIGVHA
ncbi:CBN-SRP-2 protein [Caenorhabditis brenneri]|uniref:CBN-SRP-2 protein n=2 Tax=Caenorhabditis brenneri TaxID=135651 RepID=G0NEI0_CAEBE|nr:CBN-SRP-2 protein [Caenorhabditis brenneri]